MPPIHRLFDPLPSYQQNQIGRDVVLPIGLLALQEFVAALPANGLDVCIGVEPRSLAGIGNNAFYVGITMEISQKPGTLWPRNEQRYLHGLNSPAAGLPPGPAESLSVVSLVT